ncbi:MAG: L-isoaspartyl protein carboxyl methyltransferase, partial [bacterium]|nr:L-isoaspartyl protein carboxyl methyltransferase [bacterium]
MDAIVDHLFVTGVLRTPAILDAFRAVRREHFVLPEDWRSAEQDTPLPIGYGQTILQPTTVAIMLEWLEPLPGARVLDVGSGSGWTTALLAHIVGPEGIVTGIEVIPDLVALGQQNLRKYNFP